MVQDMRNQGRLSGRSVFEQGLIKLRRILPGKQGGQDTLSQSMESPEQESTGVFKSRGADGHGGGWKVIEICREDGAAGWDLMAIPLNYQNSTFMKNFSPSERNKVILVDNRKTKSPK